MKSYKKYFQQVVYQYYPDQSIRIGNEADLLFDTLKEDVRFAEHSENPVDKRLGFAAYFLATIMVLNRDGVAYDRIREMMMSVATEFVRPRNKLQVLLKRLPAKLVSGPLASLITKPLDKRARVLAHPDGFVARILTDKKETLGFGYGVDILECGICKLFAKHDYKKFAAILCDVDYITSGLAGLKLIRTGTIAHGASKCDFRFAKK